MPLIYSLLCMNSMYLYVCVFVCARLCVHVHV